jgi:hypothetical protein
VNVAVLLVPLAVVTVTLCAPTVALAAIVKVAVIDVLLTTFTLLTVTPVPLTATEAPLIKFVPVSVTSTELPWPPEFGLTLVNAGAGGADTVNVFALLVPLAVVTVTLRAPSVAFRAIVNVAVIDVLLPTFKSLTVTPVPLTAIPVTPTKFVPISVTGTTVP